MSPSENESPSARLGPWPKVILWSLVVVFGVLYLSSGKRQPEVALPAQVVVPPSAPLQGDATEAPMATLETPAETPPAIVAAGGDSAAGGGTMGPVTGVVEEPEPLRAAESTAFADSLRAKGPAEGTAESSPDQGKAAEPTGAADINQAAEADAPPLPKSDAADVTVGLDPEAAAPAVSVGPTPPTSAEAAPPVSVGPTPPATTAAVQPDVSEGDGSAGRAGESREAERARIRMEYEALRRAAEAERRRYWMPREGPPPVPFPHWQPGYGFGGYPVR